LRTLCAHLFGLVEQNKVETSVVTSLTNQSAMKQPYSQGEKDVNRLRNDINLWATELNPISHLLALLELAQKSTLAG